MTQPNIAIKGKNNYTNSDYFIDSPSIDKNSFEKYRKIIEKLIRESYVFRNFSADIIIDNMVKWNILISKHPKWSCVIEEGSINCELFFVLLTWKLWIYKNNEQIATIEKVSVIWEIWFINPDFWRVATVKTLEDSSTMLLSQEFINNLPRENQTQFYKNLCIDMSQKIMKVNDALYNKYWWGCHKKQAEIKEIVNVI